MEVRDTLTLSSSLQRAPLRTARWETPGKGHGLHALDAALPAVLSRGSSSGLAQSVLPGGRCPATLLSQRMGLSLVTLWSLTFLVTSPFFPEAIPGSILSHLINIISV